MPSIILAEKKWASIGSWTVEVSAINDDETVDFLLKPRVDLPLLRLTILDTILVRKEKGEKLPFIGLKLDIVVKDHGPALHYHFPNVAVLTFC